MTLYYEIVVNKDGDVTKVNLTRVYPDIDLTAIEADLVDDIIKIVNNYPKLKPASFKGDEVNFVTIEKLEF